MARNDRQTEFRRHHAHNGLQLNAVVVHAPTLQTVCHKIGIAAQPYFEKFQPIELLPMILKTNQYNGKNDEQRCKIQQQFTPVRQVFNQSSHIVFPLFLQWHARASKEQGSNHIPGDLLGRMLRRPVSDGFAPHERQRCDPEHNFRHATLQKVSLHA